MIVNYFKIAWRNLVKSPFYTGVSIIGLTVGLTVGILILVWVQDEMNYNKEVSNGQLVYRVNSKLGAGSDTQVWASSPGPVAFHAKNDLPDVENVTRVMRAWGYSLFTYGESIFESEKSSYIDPSFFELFDTKFISGNKDNPFPDDRSIIITASTATKIFGSENPIGKTIEAERRDAYTIVGVIEDLPKNSSIDFDIFFPLSLFAKEYTGEGFWKSLDTDWGNYNYSTYIHLTENASTKKIITQLSDINRKNDPNNKSAAGDEIYNFQDISTLNLYRPNGVETGAATIRIFSIVALLILIIACINYINLSTARAMRRAKEVGVRKIIGAGKSQLFTQFITESVLFFGIVLVLSVVLAYMLIPLFNDLANKELDFNLLDPQLWKVILLTVLSTLVASSIYPALLLSGFKPLQAIKGKAISGMGSSSFRKVLVTVQFVFSVVLIIGTLVIGQQLDFIRTLDPGYDREQVLTFSMEEGMHNHLDAVKSQMAMNPNISDFAILGTRFVNNGYTTGDTSWDGKDPNRNFIVRQFGIDEKLIPLLDIKFAEGQNFKGAKIDSTSFILNETAVREAGIKDPVGKRFVFHNVEGTIIGVVKDFNYSSVKEKISPAVMYYEPDGYNVYIKTKGSEAQQAIASVESLWKEHNAGFPFKYSFLDTDYDNMYRSDQRTGSLFNIFSIIAILVSCLGLLGLSTYTAEQRKKEIGVRKVLGSSVANIVRLLSKDFMVLVTLAIVVAVPVAWWAMQNWLEGFAYRIEIKAWVFVIAGFLAISIAIVTVSFQAIKAAIANPVKSLRTE